MVAFVDAIEAPQPSPAAGALRRELHDPRIRQIAALAARLKSHAADREPLQAIYKLRHPVRAGACAKGLAYRTALSPRFEAEARTLAGLTGWSVASIRARMTTNGEAAAP